jgi:tripartite-type tricarboxylate transporter receptor subunit TctC
LLKFIVAMLGAIAMSTAAQAAEPYPSRPIKLVVPFAAGAQADAVARLIAERLGPGLGQSVVVENVGGAGGLIAASAVGRAPPDGYTLFIANQSTFAIVPFLQKKPQIDFTPVSMASSFSLVLVTKAGGAFKNFAELGRAAKSNPAGLTIASPGYGTIPHLVGELLKTEAGMHLTHVSYKGSAPAMVDLLGGQVDLLFDAPGALMAQIEAGKLQPLVVTSTARMPRLPNVPTMTEVGLPKLSFRSWSAVVAPPGTPPEIVSKLNAELVKVLHSPEVTGRFRDWGFDATTSTPEQLGTAIREDSKTWSQFLKDHNITIE